MQELAAQNVQIVSSRALHIATPHASSNTGSLTEHSQTHSMTTMICFYFTTTCTGCTVQPTYTRPSEPQSSEQQLSLSPQYCHCPDRQKAGSLVMTGSALFSETAFD